MEQLKIIGYYIVQIVDTPEYLREIGGHMLSVSSCLGEIHPRWETYMGGWLKGEEREYRERLKMDDEQYKECSNAVQQLFIAKQLDVDSRFLNLSVLRHFYDTYLSATDYQIVSVSTSDKYLQVLKEEMHGSNVVLNGEADSNLPLGCDILGWDISGFHSFLCNSLHKNLPAARFNHVGLLENDFEEVLRFACEIEGMGEPVEWIPCRVGKCEI